MAYEIAIAVLCKPEPGKASFFVSIIDRLLRRGTIITHGNHSRRPSPPANRARQAKALKNAAKAGKIARAAKAKKK